MRCPDCNKFVPFDTSNEPEVDLDIDEDGNITGSVRIVNNCDECGTELKDANFDVDDSTLVDKFTEHKVEKAAGEEVLGVEHVLDTTSFETEGEERTERAETKDRKGKAIRNPRYQKTLYGFSLTAKVSCSCGETFETVISDETPASYMDELV